MQTLRVLFDILSDDWETGLEILLPSITQIDDTIVMIAQDSVTTITLILFDTPLDPTLITQAAAGDVMETPEGLERALECPYHAILTVNADTWESRVLLGQVAQVLGGRTLVWEDGTYICDTTMAAIAAGILDDTAALFSIAGWENEQGTLGFLAKGLFTKFPAPITTLAHDIPESSIYTQDLSRFQTIIALLATQPGSLSLPVRLQDPQDPNRTIFLEQTDTVAVMRAIRTDILSK